jgi:pilus assembly protein CpaD
MTPNFFPNLLARTAPMSRMAPFPLISGSLLAAALLAGCAKQPLTTGSIEPSSDYRENHPIVIDEKEKWIDIYPMRGPGGLDKRQREDIAAFVRDYRETARGALELQMPSGAGQSQVQTGHYIRKALGEAGFPSSHLRAGHYEPSRASEVAPVRLTFHALAAKVDSQCGMWKRDILDASTTNGMANRPYDNFGCSYQNILAAQVANPADLARPRIEGESDIGKRTDDLRQLRDDGDPSTSWSNDAAGVGN